MKNDRRVVVTGCGAISALGNSVAELWDGVCTGRCGLGLITHFDTTGYRTAIAGEVKNFDVSKYLSPKDAKRLDPYCQFAIAAADEALADAGLNLMNEEDSSVDRERVGVLVSSGIGGLTSLSEQFKVLLEKGPNRISPLMIPMMIGDLCSGNLSMRYHVRGPNMGLLSACATGCHSIGEAYWMIKRDDADMMLSGGAEAAVIPIGISGFCAMKAMSTRNDDPQHASRPFDKNRDGFVMSEGAGVLILEELEHAQKRGAKIYAEIIGYGATGDAYHITSPHPEGKGAAAAITMALKHAGLNPEAIDYINAHGTSTHLNDLYETMAIKAALGEHACKVAISSTKGSTGHALGAAGALESIICLKSIENNLVPPTINYETPDPECDLDVTPNQARECKIDVALNMNLGFGGHNGALLFKRFEN